MKNTLTDLNNHLFMALERLNDDSLDAEQLRNEMKRSQGIASLAEAIVHNADVQLKAIKLRDEMGAVTHVSDIPQNILPNIEDSSDE
jgi:hypothetical protein